MATRKRPAASIRSLTKERNELRERLWSAKKIDQRVGLYNAPASGFDKNYVDCATRLGFTVEVTLDADRLIYTAVRRVDA